MKCSTPCNIQNIARVTPGTRMLATSKNSPKKHMNKNKWEVKTHHKRCSTQVHTSVKVSVFVITNSCLVHLFILKKHWFYIWSLWCYSQGNPLHTRAVHAHQVAAGVHKPGEGLGPPLSEKGCSHHTMHLRETLCTTNLPRNRRLPSNSPWSLKPAL